MARNEDRKSQISGLGTDGKARVTMPSHTVRKCGSPHYTRQTGSTTPVSATNDTETIPAKENSYKPAPGLQQVNSRRDIKTLLYCMIIPLMRKVSREPYQSPKSQLPWLKHWWNILQSHGLSFLVRKVVSRDKEKCGMPVPVLEIVKIWSQQNAMNQTGLRGQETHVVTCMHAKMIAMAMAHPSEQLVGRKSLATTAAMAATRRGI